jgi:hypothetical protein
MHFWMEFQERQDDTVGEDLAAVVVIRVGVGPQAWIDVPGAPSSTAMEDVWINRRMPAR